MIGLSAQTKKRIGNSHRGRLDLIADILEASQGGIKKTYLMYRCNLSFRQLKYYLDFLLRTEFLCIVAENVNPNYGLFQVTDKGKQFLKAYKGLKALMKYQF